MIGRIRETKELERIFHSNKAELVAVYGRRRVGKTYLIDETFSGRFTFRHAGLSPSEHDAKGLMQAQLNQFYQSLELAGMKPHEKPENWQDAFFLLEKFLEKKDRGKRQLVFLDELPWMDTPRSGFMRAFEGFWNNWACHRKNLMVIVCGSANAWVLNSLINNHGGLYNRVTYVIKLSPFTLNECEAFFRAGRIGFSRYDMVQSYMIFGGIPYYLGFIDKGFSLAQNVDRLFFEHDAKLKDEYERLFESVFVNPEAIRKLVKTIAGRNAGYTRKEIAAKMKISDGGGLSRNLNALLASNFVEKYIPFGQGKREEHYKLTDPFCLFYLHFEEYMNGANESFWQQNTTTQPVVSWRGYAFENVCFNHIPQIKKALGISGVSTLASAWSKREDDRAGTQIDLLLSRKDNVLNMCEMKFYGGDFTVKKDYYKKLLLRQEILSEEVSPKIAVRNTLITTFGVTENEYRWVFDNVITMDELFLE